VVQSASLLAWAEQSCSHCPVEGAIKGTLMAQQQEGQGRGKDKGEWVFPWDPLASWPWARHC